MPLTPEQTAGFLAQEYLALQNVVESFDERALTIKAWSVTFSAAGLGLAYQQHSRALLLIAATSALVFWLIEAIWKYHQRAFYPRLLEIEAWFLSQSSAGFVDAPFQITSRWRPEVTGGTMSVEPGQARFSKGWRVPFFGGVLLPHVIVFIAGMLLFFFYPPQPEKAEKAEPSIIYVGK